MQLIKKYVPMPAEKRPNNWLGAPDEMPNKENTSSWTCGLLKVQQAMIDRFGIPLTHATPIHYYIASS
jgi:hypothetical protein